MNVSGTSVGGRSLDLGVRIVAQVGVGGAYPEHLLVPTHVWSGLDRDLHTVKMFIIQSMKMVRLK